MNLLISFSVISIFIAFKNSFYLVTCYVKNITLFLLIYISMSYLSIFITTKYADITYLNQKLPYIILAILLPIGFYKIKNFNFNFFKYALTLLLISIAIFIMLLNHHHINIDQIELLDLTMTRNSWTQKNYMFWYVLLTFGTLSFYNIKKKKDFFFIISIFVLSYFTLVDGYSDSAKLSFTLGATIYIIFSIFTVSKKHLFILIWIFTFYIIFGPIIISILPWEEFKNLVGGRGPIYSLASTLIKEHLLFGYGYGSTLTLNVNDILEVTKNAYINANGGKFPGGHPHNLSLLFWLEFGIFGAIFLAYFIHKLLFYMIENTYGYINQAAIFAMFVSFEIITSFSWSIWIPQVLLTFAFFGIMLTLSLNIKIQKEE